jgi:diguanylate cyclase (GGDEF)-like protein
MRILLIEDDEILLDLLRQSLLSQHHVVDAVEDGQTGWEYAQNAGYDLIVMDVDLPHLDGITLCQRLRSSGCTTPILLMTAKEAKSDQIRGLDAGADDYLFKPLDLTELQARIRALSRRGEVSPTAVLQVGALRLDPTTCQVSYGEKTLNLTPKEYNLLELFLRNPERVFSRGQIVEHLWSFDDPPLEESVKAHIKGLRQKLKAAGAVNWIENVYGIGYRLKQEVAEGSDAGASSALSSSMSVPIAASANSSLPEQFEQARETLWQQYQGLMTERLQKLQTAAVQPEISPTLRQEARQAAHKLAGVLGMFERDAGTVIARELEQLLQGEATLQPEQTARLSTLVQQLSKMLELSESPLAHCSNSSTSSLKSGLNISGLNIRALVVDDDPLFIAALRPILEPWGIQLTGLEDGRCFWQVLPTVAPDFLLLDVEMPQISGIELCQAIRADADWQNLPILFLTAHREPQTIQQGFAAGADDYITKPIVGAELITRIQTRLERNRLLQTLSTRDAQTGLPNQPSSSRNLERLIQQRDRGERFCLVLFMLPELRQINLQQGHSIGNQVLQRWGTLFQAQFQSQSKFQDAVIGYWGNGEFVVGLPKLTKLEAKEHLSDVLLTLRQQVFTGADGTRFQASFSYGIAEYPTDASTLQSLYQAASLQL